MIPISMQRYFLPKRTVILIEHIPQPPEILIDVFMAYFCLDCSFTTKNPQEISDHQKTWHGWRYLWQRLCSS